MEYKALSLQQAMDVVVMEKLIALGGEGGMIGVDAAGTIAFSFNSKGMYRASISEDSDLYIGIYR
jgi:beta-aspartyl-peptidase (threonine type)